MEYLDHLVRRGMNLIHCCIAQINHKRVFLVFRFIVDPSAVGLLNGISAEMPDQNILCFLQSFRLRENRLVCILVVCTQIQDVLDIRVGFRPSFRFGYRFGAAGILSSA